MRPGPVAAVAVLEKYIAITDAPRASRAILQAVIEGEGWYPGDEAAEKADLWSKSFGTQVRQALNVSAEDGSVQVFSLNSRNESFIQGSCFVEPGDSDLVTEAKRKRANTLLLYQAVRERSAEELETICVRLLTLLGVADPHHTPRSGDGGVDFYGSAHFGYILKPEILPAGSEKHMKVWFVGQAKHYDSTNVSTKDIREIVGSAELARTKLFAGDKDPMKEFKARLCDPVFSIFVTTGRFSRDSLDLMKKAGVIPMDGPQLGQFLADNGVGLLDDAFDEDAFNDWILAA